MKPRVKKVGVHVVDFARNAIKMGRSAALGQILGLSGHIGHQYFQTRPFPCRIRPGGFAMGIE